MCDLFVSGSGVLSFFRLTAGGTVVSGDLGLGMRVPKAENAKACMENSSFLVDIIFPQTCSEVQPNDCRFVHPIFRKLDEDGSGSISEQEMLKLLWAFAKCVSQRGG